jgi:hypothetical protein
MTVSELLLGGGVGGVEAEAEVDELGMRRRDSPVEVIAFQILESMAGCGMYLRLYTSGLLANYTVTVPEGRTEGCIFQKCLDRRIFFSCEPPLVLLTNVGAS